MNRPGLAMSIALAAALRGFAVVAMLLVAAVATTDAQTTTPGPSACPGSIDGRTLGAQLQDLVAQLGPLTPDLRARIGLIQTVLQARDSAAGRGECDFAVYDAQLTMLANELRTLAAGTAPGAPSSSVGSPPSAAPVPPASPPAPPGPPSMSSGTTGPAPPAGPAAPSAPGGDLASKLGDVMQLLLGKLGSAGGSSTGAAPGPSDPGFSNPPPAPSAGFSNPPGPTALSSALK